MSSDEKQVKIPLEAIPGNMGNKNTWNEDFSAILGPDGTELYTGISIRKIDLYKFIWKTNISYFLKRIFNLIKI